MNIASTGRILLAALGIVAVLAGCGQSSGSGTSGTGSGGPAAAVTVKIVPDPATIGTFVAPEVTIKAGETVKWQFEDLNPHTVSSATFSSQPMDKGKTYSHTFAKAGTYMYHCAIHPEMMGTVTVN